VSTTYRTADNPAPSTTYYVAPSGTTYVAASPSTAYVVPPGTAYVVPTNRDACRAAGGRWHTFSATCTIP
jgi:hypothetical protein